MKNKIIVSLFLIFLIAISVSAVSANEDLNDSVSKTSDIVLSDEDSDTDTISDANDENLNIDEIDEINENEEINKESDNKLGSGVTNENIVTVKTVEDLSKFLEDSGSTHYDDGAVFKLGNYSFSINTPITIKKSYIIDGGKITGEAENFFTVVSPANGGPSSVTIRNSQILLKTNQTFLLAKGVAQGIDGVINVAGVTLENITITNLGEKSTALLNIEHNGYNSLTSNAITITNNTLNGAAALKFNGKQMTHGGLDGEEIYLPANEIILQEKSFIALNTNGERTAVDSSVGDSPFTFQLALVDEEGYGLINKTIVFMLNGKQYTSNTDKNGVATLKLSLSKAGIYDIYSQFMGDERYSGSKMVANTITVYEKDSLLTVKNVAYKSTASKKLSATFKDRNGNLIKNKKVTFTVNGKSYSATTNSKGVATVKISLNKKGKYTYKAKFAGDGTYAAVTKSAKLTINPVATSLTAKKYSYKKASKTKKLKATLKSGTKVLKNKKITFKVNGKSYTAKTNSKGIATVKIKLTKKGTFKYTAKFAGDSMYKAISKTNKVVIK